MIHDVVASKAKIPTCFINIALHFLLKTIKKKTGADLKKIKPIESIKKIEIPTFFLVCKEDIIARPDKVKDLFLLHSGKFKEFHMVPGEHQT